MAAKNSEENSVSGVSDIVQQTKKPAAKDNHLNSISGIHIFEGEK